MVDRKGMLELLEVDVLAAAEKLLGWTLVHGDRSARLVEVEAYRTPDDPGCHAHRRRSPKCETMFARPGLAYVYFTYGNHWMVNLVGYPQDRAAAILLRAAEPLTGLEEMALGRPKARRDEDLLSGPGKLTAAFGIHRAFDGVDLLDPQSSLRLEPGPLPASVVTGTRIGLVPGKGDDFPWRFMDGERMRWVSRPLPRS